MSATFATVFRSSRRITTLPNSSIVSIAYNIKFNKISTDCITLFDVECIVVTINYSIGAAAKAWNFVVESSTDLSETLSLGRLALLSMNSTALWRLSLLVQY